MSMFSELIYDVSKDKLERSLNKAIELNDSNVNDYCREFILPIYVDFHMRSDDRDEKNYKKIKKFFKTKNKK